MIRVFSDYDEPTIKQIGNELKAEGITIITVADITVKINLGLFWIDLFPEKWPRPNR